MLCRLLDFKNQEKYYTKIMERYMSFCSDAGRRDELLRRFSALEIGEGVRQPAAATTMTTAAVPSSLAAATGKTTANADKEKNKDQDADKDQAKTKALSQVMMALRKLREGIVASQRADEFAVQAYLFCIRLSILVKHPESYHPAILYLLRALHPRQPLESVELDEVVAYLVLDTACRRSDLADAYALRQQHALRSPKVDAVLAALAHDNYVLFRKVKSSVDGHRARLMDWAEPDIRRHALKCFGRSYLSVDLSFLESVTETGWDELQAKDGVGWELDGTKVIIRKIKAR
jgi:hypothetical protein